MRKMWKAAGVALAAVMALGMTAMAEESFKIGGIGPLTGGAATYGNAVMNAAQIAVEEINAEGGIAGYQIEFNPQDDEHDAEKSVSAYNTLKDWGMDMLLGTVTSTPCVAVSAEAANDNMFLLTPSGSSPDAIAAGDNAFRVCFSDPDQGAASEVYITEHELATKVGVIYNSSDVYSTGILATFQAQAAEASFELLQPQAFTEDSKTDFSAQLQFLKDNGADLVFLPIYYDAASVILTQAAGMDFAPVWFGVDGMDGILSLEGFDTSLAEGVMLLTPFSADAEDELTKNFVSKYQERFGEVPNQFAADAYDGIYILKAACEKAGVTPDMSASDICDALKAAMTEIEVTGVTGTMTWSANGEPTKSPKAVVIEGGVYVSAE